MKKLLSLFLGVLIAFSAFSVCASAAGSSMGNATTISFNKNYSESIIEESQEDFYEFYLSSSGSVTIKLTAYIYKTEYYLYDDNGEEIWCLENQYWNSTSEQYNINETISLTSGTYYFSVQGANGTGDYNFKLTFNSSGESFKETTGGLNNSISSSSSIYCGRTYYGQIAINDNKDFYEFYASSSGKVTISVTAYIKRSSYYLYDSNGKEIWSDKYNYSSSSSGVLNLTQEINLPSSGYYYFCVEETSFGGDYTFSISNVASNTYTVYYNANGGAVSPSSVTVMHGETTKLPRPSKILEIRYDANGGVGAPASQTASVYCKGWTSSYYSTVPDYSCGVYYKPTSNINLYAVWQDTTSLNLSTDVPVRNGYTFLGWSTNANATYATYEPRDYISIYTNMYLYAVWQKNPEKCNVYYDANGGSVENSSVVSMSGQTISLPVPVKSYNVSYNANGGSNAPSMISVDVVCKGWSENKDALNAMYLCGSEYMVTKNVTLYAIWNATADVKLNLDIPVRDGYSFLGWSENQTASVPKYKEGEEITVSADTVLYAIWEENPTYTIFYDANGGVDAPESQVQYEKGFKLSYNKPERNGYEFLGWSKYSNATTPEYLPGDIIEISANTTLYAVWKEVVVVTFSLSYNANGGSGAPSTQTGSTIYTVSSMIPVRNGYTFLGWSTNPYSSVGVYDAGEELILTSDTTLYAIWKKVNGVVTDVKVSDIALNYKATAMLSVDVTGTDYYTAEYESSNTSVVSVDENGNITVTGTGTAEITVTVTDEYGNVVEDTCTVTVSYAWWQWLIIIFLFGWIWY